MHFKKEYPLFIIECSVLFVPIPDLGAWFLVVSLECNILEVHIIVKNYPVKELTVLKVHFFFFLNLNVTLSEGCLPLRFVIALL